MWAGVFLLVPLVAELAEAQKCSGVPDAPEHATVRCFKKRNTCRAMCQDGYLFSEMNSKTAMYKCQGGEWVMQNGQADRCDPVCDPPCENGECIEPDTCDCDEGFTGDLCDEDEGGYEEEEEEEDYDMSTTEEPTTEGYEEDEEEDAYDGDEDEDED